MSDTNNSNVEKSTESFPKKVCGLAIYSLMSIAVSISFIAISYPIILYAHNRIVEGFFVFGIFIFSIIAFVLGIVAIVIIHINRKKMKGDWYALLAIFLSLPFVFIMTSGVFVNANRAKQKKILDGQLIGNVIVQYAKDHNGYLPDANQWCDLLIEYERKLPEDRFRYNSNESRFKYHSSKDGVCNYAFNTNLSGAEINDVPYNAVLVFESKGEWNLNGTEELFRKTHKKRQYVYIYTKEVETGHNFPIAINTEDATYGNIVWKLPKNNKEQFNEKTK